ncbi:TPA: thioredoxin family protein [Candidatus Micrarchaeota archaeon]|nr:MAG: thioredoxin family protein [Candidatus Micrarchaeota archaeon CG1_02_51_15]HII39166.1 thioredoxin family protein [Candidatus Micrarchaeota archaeon]
MKIEILGMGCAKCAQLAENVKKALESSGKKAEVTKVTDLNAIMNRGVISTPALVIDGKVKCTGRIPDPKEIAEWVTA